MHAVDTIAPGDYARIQNAANAPVLIDVRETWEYQLSRIEGARLMSLGSIRDWAATLDKNGSYVIMCHHGMRSEYACRLLASFGFRHVWNLDGGIDAWSQHVDTNVTRY